MEICYFHNVAALYPAKSPGVYLTVGCERPRAGLDAVQKRKTISLSQEPNPDLSILRL